MTTKTAIAILALTTSNVLAETSPSPTPQPDKLKEALGEMITGVTQTAGQAKEFIVGQLPDVVRQLLLWKMAESIWSCIWPGFLFLIALKIAKRFRANAKTNGWEYINSDEEPVAMAQIFSWAGVHAFLIGSAIFWLSSANITWLQIWLAPKVYLIEYAKTLIGK